MDDEERRAWLVRRIGFGASPAERDADAGRSVDALTDALLAPPTVPDPWAGLDLSGYDPTLAPKDKRSYTTRTIAAWLVSMATTPAPFAEWLRWFWHGHFVSTLRAVQQPQLLVDQLGLFGPDRLGLGRFGELLRAVTIDPAMLRYLDGTTNRRGAVNENYGREVLELFALGIGNYTEADVRAGAEALTGWHVDRRDGTAAATARFDPRRHDDTPKAYLGTTVHDVDTVVAAITAHPACAPFVTRQLVEAILGTGVDGGLVQRLAADFAASGLAIGPLVRAIVDAGLDGASQPLVLAPVPWLATMIRATGAPADRVVATVGERGLVAAGQVPMDAPNVAGWPDRRAWLSSSATVARANLAAGIASLVPADAAVRDHARRGDLDALAHAFDLPRGFSAATVAALGDVRANDRTGDAVLTVAMASPDLVVA